jgi:hypothetical protein
VDLVNTIDPPSTKLPFDIPFKMAEHNAISDIYFKIDRERAVINGAVAMLRQPNNPLVKAGIETQIKEARKNIAYLEQKMAELELRNNGGDGRPSAGNNNSFGHQDNQGYDYGSPQAGEGYSYQLNAGSGVMPPRPPFGPSAPGSSMPKARPNYSKLGMSTWFGNGIWLILYRLNQS